MPDFTTAQFRNVALLGHAGAGKTTLIEHLLHDLGVIGKPGAVEQADTVADFEAEEKEHHHSLFSSLIQCDAGDTRLNLIDTPGYPDLIGQAITATAAVEIAAVVVDAARGIQTVTRRMMSLAEDRNLPRMIVVNKIDAPELDLPGLIEQLREAFGSGCLPINLPAGGGSSVVDCFGETEGEADFSSVADAHTSIVDQVVEVDDDLMEAYLETGEAPPPDKLRDAFKRALREGHLVPICFASARENVGVKEFTALLTDLCPSPFEGNPRPFVKIENDQEQDFTPEPDPDKPLCAHVFKIATDPFVGKLAYFRVHQGTLKSNSQAFRNDEKKALRIGHLVHLRGKDHEECDSIAAGDIGAVAKVEELRLNDILHDDHALDHVRFHPPTLPRPMFGQAISPKSRGDEAKVGQAVAKLMDEDPTFIVERVPATKQTVARGVGELHMRVMLERLKNRFSVEVETETPKVPYKETISANGEGHHRHKKQTGGAGQFGEVFLRIEPLPADHETGFEFIDDTFGGSVPKQFMPAIEKGIREALEDGVIAGYPFTGVKVSVYDGKHHPVDSKEVAFVTAGKKAFIDAVNKAKPVLLEPYVNMEITAPQDHLGDITADISGKRGRIQGTDMLPGGMCAIRAVVPHAEVRAYASQLKSMTAGQGTYTMDYSHSEPCPPNIQQEIVAQHKPKQEEE